MRQHDLSTSESREIWRRAYSAGTFYDLVTSAQVGLSDVERTLFDRYAPDVVRAIVNVGCGAGRETLELRRCGYPTVIGVDISTELLDVARRTAADLGLVAEFRQAHAGKLPIETATVDVVTMFTNLFGYLTPATARRDALREALRVLRPGGRLMIVVTSLHHLGIAHASAPLLDALHRIYNPHMLAPGDRLVRGVGEGAFARRPRSHWFRKGEIEQQAAEVGLAVVLTTTSTGLLTGTRRLRGAGQLVCVLERPAVDLHAGNALTHD